MKWIFDPYPPSLVEQDVTQGDQFRNDDVDLPDSLGREAIQNSLDALLPGGGPVRLRFSLLTGASAPAAEFMNRVLEGNLIHAEAAGVDRHAVNFAEPSALIIEDFGTRGLTGSFDSKDEDNFCDFWRRHGRSHKSGQNLGRWGLGKLVFSMTSQIKTFFGYTIQCDSKRSALMGQAVFGMHRINEIVYPAHGFFGDRSDPNDPTSMPVPVQDDKLVSEFLQQFRLRRQLEPGLSVIIPYPDPAITPESMVDVVILNYFIPILRRHLVLEINDLTIDHTNVLAHALSRKISQLRDIPQVFEFVRQASSCTSFVRPIAKDWHSDGRLAEEEFRPEDLAAMRASFAAGDLVAVELPIAIHQHIGEPRETCFHVFVKKPQGIARGQDFYVRGGISLPQESKFRDRRALGMLIAEDAPIATFLGDAENAAHTKWNGRAEKLQKYHFAEKTLRAIRNSVVALHDHLAQAIEEENERALIDYFWTPGNQPAPADPREPVRPEPPMPPPPPPPLPIRLTDIAGGVHLAATPHLTPSILPLRLSVQFAYDVPTGNPFKLYSPDDFDLSNEDAFAIMLDGLVEAEATANALHCVVSDSAFSIRVVGFDANRDLVTRVRIDEV